MRGFVSLTGQSCATSSSCPSGPLRTPQPTPSPPRALGGASNSIPAAVSFATLAAASSTSQATMTPTSAILAPCAAHHHSHCSMRECPVAPGANVRGYRNTIAWLAARVASKSRGDRRTGVRDAKERIRSRPVDMHHRRTLGVVLRRNLEQPQPEEESVCTQARVSQSETDR